MIKLILSHKILAISAAATVAAAGAGTALASSPNASTTAVTYHGCENARTRTPFDVFTTKTPTCPTGAWHVNWSQTGPQGPAGTAGPAGATGPAGPTGDTGPKGDTGATGSQGPAGADGATGPAGPKGDTGAAGPAGPQGPAGPAGAAISTSSNDFPGPITVNTGGGFVANSTLIDTAQFNLPAGENLVCMNAKATPNSSGDTAQIFPQFFLYTQAKSSSFAGDVLNTGTGALEPDGTNHDSYFSGCTLLNLSDSTTMFVYAFGYDSDTGAGSYKLDDLTVTDALVAPVAGG